MNTPRSPQPPKSIVVGFVPEDMELTIQIVDEATLQPLLTGTVFPILLSDFGDKIDDEIARRFAVAILNCLARYKPELVPLMSSVTQEPQKRPE
ncbi:hypothetical protein QFZ98_000296 [Paraburkholderia youngii]